MKLLFIICILVLTSLQVVGQENEPSTSTSVFINTNWSKTSRKLIVNDGLFGDYLGERANETNLNLWSFGLGFRSEITKNIMWEGGVSFQQNGEQYSFEQTDSSYQYESKYTYISLPIKVYYKYGKAIRVIGGLGIVPQMFVKFHQKRNWTDSNSIEGSETIKTTIGHSSFVISSVFNLGVEMDFSDKVTLFFIPEYKVQLTSSYLKTNSYKHYGRSLGINMGLSFKL